MSKLDLMAFSTPAGLRTGTSGKVALPAIVVAFVTFVKSQGARLQYATLSAVVRTAEGKALCSNRSAGHHGSGRAKALEGELQTAICGQGGHYSKDAIQAWEDNGHGVDESTLKTLQKQPYLEPAPGLAAFIAWQEAEAKKADKDS